MFGDVRANAYGVDAQSGALLWKTKVDEHASARITGAPSFANGRLFVPVSSIEEVPGARPNYPCCTFRGSVVALDAATGKQFWKTYMIAEEPKIVGKNSAGTPMWKPAGAAIWTSPTLDLAKNLIYVATGNAYTEPAAPTSDAVVALDMKSGTIQWVQQATPNDVFVIGCKPGVENCPDDVGPDFDFGNSPILRTLAGGRRILTLGQKSGVVYGLAPDDKGKILWQFRAGKGGALGGIEWGSAADEQNIYVPGLRRAGAVRQGRRPLRHPSDDRRTGVAHAGAGAALHDRPRLHRRAVRRDQRDARHRVLGIGGRTSSRLFHRRRENRLDVQHDAAVRDGQRRQGAGRIDRRRRPGDRRRAGADEFRLRPVARETGERVARVRKAVKRREVSSSSASSKGSSCDTARELAPLNW